MKIAEKILNVLCMLAAAVGTAGTVQFAIANQKLAAKGAVPLAELRAGYNEMLAYAQNANTWGIIALVLSIAAIVLTVLNKTGKLTWPVIRSVLLVIGITVCSSQLVGMLKDDHLIDIAMQGQAQAQQAGSQMGLCLMAVMLLFASVFFIPIAAFIKEKKEGSLEYGYEAFEDET